MRAFVQNVQEMLERLDVRILEVLGRGAFYAWINLVILGQISSKGQEAYSFDYWFISIASVVVLLGISVLIALRFPKVFCSCPCVIGASCILPLGWLLGEWGGSDVSSIMSCILIAGASACLMLAWGGYYSFLAYKDLAKEIAGSLILASVVYYVLFNAGGILEILLIALLPPISAVCFLSCASRKKELLLLDVERKSSGNVSAHTSSQEVSILLRRYSVYALVIMVFSAMPRLVRELALSPMGAMTVEQVNRCIFLATLFVAIGLLLTTMKRAEPSSLKSAALFIFPLSGLGLCMFSVFGYVSSGYFVICMGYTLFDLIVSIALLREASNIGRHRIAFIGAGYFLLRSGLLLGTILAFALMRESSRWDMLPEASLLIFVVMVFVAMPIAHRWTKVGNPVASKSSDLLADRICLAAKKYKLTDREAELYAYIAQGRSVEFASRELHIAKSTAASHVSNLYKKLNVSGKQEALDVLDSLD